MLGLTKLISRSLSLGTQALATRCVGPVQSKIIGLIPQLQTTNHCKLQVNHLCTLNVTGQRSIDTSFPLRPLENATNLPQLTQIRQFHMINSKKNYLDFRYRSKVQFKANIMVIRRQKMRKHKRLKWRKKFRSVIAKKHLKREIAKEKMFRVELLSMIRRAEQFDPREYAMRKIMEEKNKPKQPTKQEIYEKTLDLVRKHRYQVTYVKPKHRTEEF